MAWEQQGMCESALRVKKTLLFKWSIIQASLRNSDG
jgi:hypothetical protein